MHALKFRPATPDDEEFLYQLLKATMRGYVDQIWGWDEDWQRAYFHMRFDPAKNQIVVLDDQDVGVISVEWREDVVHLCTLFILPEYQGRGIGTQLISALQAAASREGLPMTLRVLKVNPAKRLYERLGFMVVEEDEARYVMKTTPP
jgi:ribosomal protein S18 acetylase RimI-like enzyme